MARFATFGPENVIYPRLDPIGGQRRLDPNQTPMLAYLGGRPVLLSHPDPATRRPGMPADLTVPLTVSRVRRELDLEAGRAVDRPFFSSAVDYVPLDASYMGFGAASFTRDVINCCPWRLPAPRPLTPYEWTVVQQAIAAGTGGGAAGQTMAAALTGVIAAQNQCPSWKTSAFGPAPAVNTYAYGCLGSWYASLDPASQARFLSDAMATKVLCSANPPWSSCPIGVQNKLWTPPAMSEYGQQRGLLGTAAVDACSDLRQRTVYLPMDGKSMTQMLNLLYNGQVPAQLDQLIKSGGALLANRSFLVGVRLFKTPSVPLGQLLNMTNMLQLAQALVEDIVLIWAPGQGTSIRDMVLSGTIDVGKLSAILAAIAPDAMGDLLSQLPAVVSQQLPQLMQQLPDLGALLGSVLGGLSAPKSQLVASPQTPATTGLAVVDQRSDQQNTTPPVGPEATTTMSAKQAGLWLMGIVVLSTIVIVAMR